MHIDPECMVLATLDGKLKNSTAVQCYSSLTKQKVAQDPLRKTLDPPLNEATFLQSRAQVPPTSLIKV